MSDDKNTGETFIAAKAKGSAATAKAGALNDSDMLAAAKKIDELGQQSADSETKNSKSSDDLKKRANEAKQRAQKKILDKAYVSDKVEDPLERLANTFNDSAKRWEMVVYPSLFAFVLLAGYGFFLIFRLTHDISTLSQSVTRMAVIVSDSMPRMTKDLRVMTSSVDNMTGNIKGMTSEIRSMSGQMNTLTPMSENISDMSSNVGSMNRSVYGMQRDMHGMNRTVSSGPFGMMNDMMPFGSTSNVPPPMVSSPESQYGSQYGAPYVQQHIPKYGPQSGAPGYQFQPRQVYTAPISQTRPVRLRQTGTMSNTQNNLTSTVTSPGPSSSTSPDVSSGHDSRTRSPDTGPYDSLPPDTKLY